MDVRIRNNGPNPADHAEVTETLPTSVVPDLLPPGCAPGGPGLLVRSTRSTPTMTCC